MTTIRTLVRLLHNAASMADESDKKLAAATTPHDEKLIETLCDALMIALPYVEMAEHDDIYKPGAVRAVVRKMRHALTRAQYL